MMLLLYLSFIVFVNSNSKDFVTEPNHAPITRDSVTNIDPTNETPITFLDSVTVPPSRSSLLDKDIFDRILSTSPSLSSPSIDSFQYLDNGLIRLGIDLSRGGSIGWLGPSSNQSLSLLNIHDFGREVQGSFYSGPNVFNPDGKCSEPGGWGQPWPWNPIGSGDVYLHASPVLNLTISPDNTSAIVWTLPYQWACDHVPCDCLFEQHITLNGLAVEVALTLHTNRNDTTFYSARTQELPAVYITGDYCNLFTYNGSSPFTNDTITQQPAAWGTNAWSSFTSGERWMAFVNHSGYGVGVVSPAVAHFGSGFFNNGINGVYDCVPKNYGPYDNPTGYISPWAAEIIDPKAAYAYEFALVLGNLIDIRNYAYTRRNNGKDEPLIPQYDFVTSSSRRHCVYNDMQDTGIPVLSNGLQLNMTGPHPTIFGPVTMFKPNEATIIAVNVSYSTTVSSSTMAAMWYIGFNGSINNPCSTCVLLLPIVPDGNFHTLFFDLTKIPGYLNEQAILQIIFQPLGAASIDPTLYGQSLVNVSSIISTTSLTSSSLLSSSSSSSISSTLSTSILSSSSILSSKSSSTSFISNTEFRTTLTGDIVGAQDGNLLNRRLSDGSFALVGILYGDCPFVACKNQTFPSCGFSMASFRVWTSLDLSQNSWTLLPNEILPPADRPLGIYFRTHLIFNSATNKYVLWVRWLNVTGSTLTDDSTYYLTATSNSLDGPYEIAQVIVPMFYNNSADDNLFVDDDGEAYIAHTCRSCGTHIIVERLSSDYTQSLGYSDPTMRSDPIGPGLTEAPSLFKYQGNYYLTMAHLCCYCIQGAETLVFVAKSPLGPYSPLGSLGNAPSAQQNFVFVHPDLEAPLWVGNRWGSDPNAKANGTPPLFDK
jgi:hypothetical protein